MSIAVERRGLFSQEDQDLLRFELIERFGNPDDFEEYLEMHPETRDLHIMEAPSEEHVFRYLKHCLKHGDDKGIYSVVSYALKNCSIPLLEKMEAITGERCDFSDKKFIPAIHSCVIAQGYIDMLRFVIERGFSVNSLKRKSSALSLACARNKIDVVSVLLEHGATPNDWLVDRDDNIVFYFSSLQKALFDADIRILDLLIMAGVDLHTFSRDVWYTVVASRNLEKIQRVRDMGVSMPDDIIQDVVSKAAFDMKRRIILDVAEEEDRIMRKVRPVILLLRSFGCSDPEDRGTEGSFKRRLLE